MSSSALTRVSHYLGIKLRDSIVFILITVSLVGGGSYLYAAWTNITPTQTQFGAPVTQSLMDAIRTNLDDLNSRINILTPITTWQTPVFSGDWRQCGAAEGCPGNTYRVGYMKDSIGFLRLKGLVVSTSGLYNGSNPVFTLPVGYRPTDNAEFAVAMQGGYAHIIIGSNGTVNVENYFSSTLQNRWVSLDGIQVPLF